FAEPSGAAALAGLKRLLDAGVIDRSDRVVVLVTGTGLKDIEFAKTLISQPPIIEPNERDLGAALKAEGLNI
ncbi:MAG: threonine synthase, partial [Nitrososphaerota archaeon]|nr:threonine synthase [Nitrososphaerota archaeon]